MFKYTPVFTSSIFLITANLIPLFAVLFLDWNVFEVLALFWMENVVVGVLNVARMATQLFLRKAYEAALMIPFFCFHYGMFTAVHGIFVISMFAPGGEDVAGTVFENMDSGAGPLGFMGVLSAMMSYPGMVYAVTGLFVSHLLSFLFNYIGKGEYLRMNVTELMHSPYKRIIILHMTILFGGFLVMATGESLWALVLLIFLKIVIDMAAHLHEHGAFKRTAVADA